MKENHAIIVFKQLGLELTPRQCHALLLDFATWFFSCNLNANDWRLAMSSTGASDIRLDCGGDRHW